MSMKMKFVGAFALSVLAASGADAAVTFDISQSGADVVTTVSGTFDSTGLSGTGIPAGQRGVLGNIGFLIAGNRADQLIYYTGLANGPSFGNGTYTAATSSTGTSVGFRSDASAFFIDSAYAMGPIAGSSVYAGTTLAAMGLTIGTYNFTIGGNSVTLNIGQMPAAAVPEPAAWAMMIVGMGMIGFALRRQKVTTRVFYAA